METIKDGTDKDGTEKKGRGGSRQGAGRPRLELHQEAERKVTKSITLSQEDWNYLAAHAEGTLSEAIHAALEMAGNTRSGAPGWKQKGRG